MTTGFEEELNTIKGQYETYLKAGNNSSCQLGSVNGCRNNRNDLQQINRTKLYSLQC